MNEYKALEEASTSSDAPKVSCNNLNTHELAPIISYQVDPNHQTKMKNHKWWTVLSNFHQAPQCNI